MRLYSVMSREMPKVPMIRPSGSRSGILVVDTQRTLPSGKVSFSCTFTSGTPGAQDVLLVAKGLLGVLAGEEVESVLPSASAGSESPSHCGHVPADAGEAAVARP